MSEIKPVPVERFDMGYSFYGYPEMQSSETGDYVEFAAYEALKAESAAQAKRIADLVKAYDQKLLDAERVLQESNSTWHRLLTLEEARVKELEQAASINQESN